MMGEQIKRLESAADVLESELGDDAVQYEQLDLLNTARQLTAGAAALNEGIAVGPPELRINSGLDRRWLLTPDHARELGNQ